MALALLANVTPRVIEILGANPGVWGSTVSGTVGAFPNDAEITVALGEADAWLVTKGYFNSINNSLAEPFMTFGSPLPNMTKIPFHYGNIGQVQVAKQRHVMSGANTSSGLITATTAPATGSPITFFVPSGNTIPTGLVAGTTYIAEYASATTFYATTVADGAVVVPSTTGSAGMICIEWQEGVESQSKDDIINARAVTESYVESGSFDYLWNITDNTIFTAADYARVEVPTYTRSTSPFALQANQADEPILIAQTVALLTKNASPAMFAEWSQRAEMGLQAIIRDGSYQPGNPDVNA